MNHNHMSQKKNLCTMDQTLFLHLRRSLILCFSSLLITQVAAQSQENTTRNVTYAGMPCPEKFASVTGDTILCLGNNVNTITESVTLTAHGGGTYAWSNGLTTKSITVNVAQKYTVTVTSSVGCVEVLSKEVVRVKKSFASITGDATLCLGENVNAITESTTLTAHGGVAYAWDNGSTTKSIAVNVAKTYSVTVTSDEGCEEVLSKAVVRTTKSFASITGDAILCLGKDPNSVTDSTTLTAHGGIAYKWGNGSTTQSITVNSLQVYFLTVTSDKGCKQVLFKEVVGAKKSFASVSGDTTLCLGKDANTITESTTLTAYGGVAYAWSNGSKNQSITVNVPQTFTVSVTSDEGCEEVLIKKVIRGKKEIASAGRDTTICSGANATLKASGGGSYRWSNGFTTQSITPSTQGRYVVTVTSPQGCIDEDDVTVNVRLKTKVTCLTCLSKVTVSLDKNCQLLVKPEQVMAGFNQCENAELLKVALEVIISDGNNDSYLNCPGTYDYVVVLKKEYEGCFEFTPCGGKITAENKTAPELVCAPKDFTLDCYDVDYVLNNYKTIGNLGASNSPRPADTSNFTIYKAEGVVGTGDACNIGLLPPDLLADNIKNLGYAYFKSTCNNCGCRITLKWSDKVVFYSCDNLKTNGGIYATIFREWVATDCNGLRSNYVQKIHFARPDLDDFAFNGIGEGKYDRVVAYNSCTPEKSLIKKEDVTPYVCSYFNTSGNPRCLFIDQVECNYSVSIKDIELPGCGGKSLKIDREMYVNDKCTGGIVDTFHILIKIADLQAPGVTFAEQAPYVIDTDSMGCTGSIPKTLAGIKSTFGVAINDNCSLAEITVKVYTKDRYVNGILVKEGDDSPFCNNVMRNPAAELRDEMTHGLLGPNELHQKEDICWEPVEYTVVNGMMVGLPVSKHLMVIDAYDACNNARSFYFVFEVQDKQKLCPSSADTLKIRGTIATEGSGSLQGVSVTLSGSVMQSDVTDRNGNYEFVNITKGGDFTVTPQMDKNHLNGVSTFDLVLMQKHILGIQPLNSPYKMIAADANNSKSISALDMVQIRRLILNIGTHFVKNTSWRFVDASYRFPNPTNPWSTKFPEVIGVNDLETNVQANFMAIKVGDVNASASVNGAVSAEIRTAEDFKLKTQEQNLMSGSEYKVSFSAEDLQNIQGYQFALNLDQNRVDLLDIEYGVAKAENFGVFKDEGIITTSWNSHYEPGALFTLLLRAKVDGKLSQSLSLNRLVHPEAYDQNNKNLGIALNFEGIKESEAYELRQNTPNPFNDETVIGFSLPKATKGNLTVRDVKGATIYKVEGNFAKGENQLSLKKSLLRSSGVLYYTLATPGFTATKKMVILE